MIHKFIEVNDEAKIRTLGRSMVMKCDNIWDNFEGNITISESEYAKSGKRQDTTNKIKNIKAVENTLLKMRANQKKTNCQHNSKSSARVQNRTSSTFKKRMLSGTENENKSERVEYQRKQESGAVV